MMVQNNLFGSSGFRLDSFQFYNWGVFDEKIYTMSCNGDSALLTGNNGSGKTTLVDALVSLIVPPRIRFYNQSSGTEQRRERTEESYVLGACNTKREEGNYSAQAEYLRTKQNALSCLLGVFHNAGTEADVTLFQVRYFSGEGKLQQMYAIAPRAVLLEEIYSVLSKAELLFDRQGKWKKLLQDAFTFVFFDSFPKYSARFSQLFGFRSEKALNLFSQTVGVKELDNLNEFIRTKMFEQLNMEDEFLALYKNYSDLLTAYNEIEKTQEQLRLLQPILESGKKLDAEKLREAEYTAYRDITVLWFCRNAIDLTERDLAQEEFNRNIDTATLTELDIKIEKLNQDIEELRSAQAQNKVQILIQSLENKIIQGEKDKAQIQENLEKYRYSAVRIDCSIPKTAVQFEKNRQQAEKTFENCLHNLQKIKDVFKTAYTEEVKIKEQITFVKNELESLAQRQSNIPLENLRIREFICKGIGCSETDIPFAGELIQVAPQEEQWSLALEKLLHHFGLSLIVPETLYKKVNTFVHSHNLKGRVVYFRADNADPVIMKNKSERLASGKLQIKQDHSLALWVKDYIDRRFDFLCTDDMNEFTRAEKAVTSSALIKSKDRHEKDDREKSAFSTRILGWNNRAKRQELSAQLEELNARQETAEQKNSRLQEQEDNEREKSAACKRLLEFTNWSALDLQSAIAAIQDYTKEKDNLLKNDAELKMLHARMETCRQDFKELNNERDTVVGRIASRNTQIKNLEEKLSEYRNSATAFEEVPEQDKKINDFSAALELSKEVQTIKQLEENQKIVTAKIQRELDRCGNSIKTHTGNIQRSMGLFVRPEKIVASKYPSWTADVVSLSDTADSIDDYRRLAEKLEKDDLPRYKNEFRKYLKEQLAEGIINFHQTLENWEQKIKTGIEELNRSLRLIPYNTHPPTYLSLDFRPSNDERIALFRARERTAIPDMGRRFVSDSDNAYDAEEAEFLKIQELITFLKEDDSRRKMVLDVRNWFNFSAIECFSEDNTQKQFYQNSASLSGGEKAKLAYTILASAIAFQFGINDSASSDNSFRFVIIDEAFSKIDPRNSQYAMELFKLLELQLLVVTPMDKINIVENYIQSVHLTENHGTSDARLISMTIQTYMHDKEQYAQS